MAQNLTFGSNTPASLAKLAEAVVYVAHKTKGEFGSIKINKTIYYADLEAFKTLGGSITGAQYHKIRLGPVPKHILMAERKLENENALEIDRDTMNHSRVAKRAPNLDLFKDSEIKILDAFIEDLAPKSAMQVSEESHDIRWDVVRNQDLLPYEFAFLDGTVTEKDEKDAQRLSEEMGW